MAETVAARRVDELPRQGHPESKPDVPRSGRMRDAGAIAGYVAFAVYVTGHFWVHPSGRASGANGEDQALFEWLFAHAARAVTHLDNPLFSDRLNQPDGINTMANTSVLGIAVPLTPVTLLFGPSVSYVVALTLAFVATATAWYFVFSRYVVSSRFAAFASAGFCAFAPGMLSQANGHLHMLAQFLVPLIVWRIFRLGTDGRPVRDGVILGLLVTYQAFVGEEVLLFTALASAVAVLAYLAFRPRAAVLRWRPFLTGLGVAVAVSAPLLAYPLYWQFAGPGHYRSVTWFSKFNADLGAYPRFSPLTFGGTGSADAYAQNVTELNAFFGWPLLLVAAGIAIWLRRDVPVRVAAVVAVVFAACSLGKEVTYAGRPTGVPGPWRFVADLPIFNVAVSTRLALGVAAAIGVLLAIGLDRALSSGGHPTWLAVPRAGLAALAVVVVALLPIAPRPLPAVEADPVPVFFTRGIWRDYVPEDRAVMPVPPTKESSLPRCGGRLASGWTCGSRSATSWALTRPRPSGSARSCAR